MDPKTQGESGTQAVEKKWRKVKRRRVRLQNKIHPIRVSIPERFALCGDSEQIAEGYGIVRADCIDRALVAVYRRVERLEAELIMAGAASPDKKEPQRAQLSVVRPEKVA